jgi:hypothetical protein
VKQFGLNAVIKGQKFTKYLKYLPRGIYIKSGGVGNPKLWTTDFDCHKCSWNTTRLFLYADSTIIDEAFRPQRPQILRIHPPPQNTHLSVPGTQNSKSGVYSKNTAAHHSGSSMKAAFSSSFLRLHMRHVYANGVDNVIKVTEQRSMC